MAYLRLKKEDLDTWFEKEYDNTDFVSTINGGIFHIALFWKNLERVLLDNGIYDTDILNDFVLEHEKKLLKLLKEETKKYIIKNLENLKVNIV